VRRFQKHYLGKPDEAIEPGLLTRGYACLDRMDAALRGRPWFAGEALSLADVALVAYTRLAHEGGFDLAPYPAIRDWITRTEVTLPIRS
jgi:glutathione S-transferase